MTDRKACPSGFVAKCRCGVYVAAVDLLRTPAVGARTMLGRWLWDGLTVEPRFGSWVEKIDACQCGKGGEDADEIERLRKRVEELEAKLASYDRADRDLNEALNMGDGSYRP